MAIHWLHPSDSLLLTTVGWTAMMSVMMAPTVMPWVVAFHRFGLTATTKVSRLSATVAFVSGYVAIWLLFGLVAASVQTIFGTVTDSGGAILLGAGLFQLTPLKRACLTHCRNPFSFLLARWKDGPLPAFHLGLSHGAYCLGCCWALMITSFAVGLMSLWWMAALATITFVEQATKWGARLRVPIGLTLIATGIWRTLLTL